jgi:hypothetical protein
MAIRRRAGSISALASPGLRTSQYKTHPLQLDGEPCGQPNDHLGTRSNARLSAQRLYDFLPGKPHPYGYQTLSFPGVAAEFGLAGYWRGGSKQPAIRRLLERVLNSGTGRFSALIAKIVERSLTYRKRSNPVTRDEIERLNAALLAARVQDSRPA